MKKCFDRCLKDPYYFIETTIRYTFAIMFIMVFIKKIRMGYGGFAEGLVDADTLIAREVPAFLLMLYGYALPIVELGIGVLLLINKHVKEAYIATAILYLLFTFGQMYNLNTSKIGTEYFPSIVALSLAYYSRFQIKK